jgi:hypothetical protein
VKTVDRIHAESKEVVPVTLDQTIRASASAVFCDRSRCTEQEVDLCIDLGTYWFYTYPTRAWLGSIEERIRQGPPEAVFASRRQTGEDRSSF